MINQIWELSTKDKGDIIVQGWIYNLNERCQVQGRDNTSPEVKESQLKDEKEDSGSENLSDCDYDQTVGVHKNITEGSDISNQQKVIETILDWEREHSNRRKRRPPTRNEDFFMGENQISLFSISVIIPKTL
ncbi:hypothetical protein B7P43_G17876 [Cryptotermes secundus]|uniref:Uncharacterized protein n=1 Tax=Cryptotermes secundus TaxID=105785 RepID=A0A2J7Q065_9NEOP|nr:hypothetical protein B7P43_G17876 [Cryptotermes secundus]